MRKIAPKVSELIKSHIPGIDFENDQRLPNGICANCRQGLNRVKGHPLPEPADYTQFNVTYPHNEATCPVCKLGRMNIIDARQMASLVAAGKRGENLILCPNCLSYKTEGVIHDCKLSYVPKVEQPLTSSQVITQQPDAKQGKRFLFMLLFI